MTLGNMRSLGVRSPAISCSACHHGAIVNVDAYPDDRAVPPFRGLCTRCGARGQALDVRPNWLEQHAAGT